MLPLRRWLRSLRRLTPQQESAERVARLRKRGARIGEGCLIFSELHSTEPYLIDIGDRVGIAGGVTFITHNFVSFRLRKDQPEAMVFGPVRVGSDTLIGQNAILLPGTVVGSECVINAGALVRGTIPDGSVVEGNPAKVIGRTSVMMQRVAQHRGRVDVFGLSEAERRARIERHFGLGGEPTKKDV